VTVKVPLTICTASRSFHIIGPLPPKTSGALLWNFKLGLWESALSSLDAKSVIAVIRGHVQVPYCDSGRFL